MTLRAKTLLTVGLTLVLLTSLLYGIAELILGAGYQDLEAQNVAENVNRAASGLQTSLDALQVFTIDWAHWDDTANFVTGRFSDFPDVNLVDSFYSSANVDWSVFFDGQGEIVNNRFLDAATLQEMEMPAGLAEYIQPDSPLLHLEDVDGTAGLISLPSGIMLIAAIPITNSDAALPIYGTMIFGRMLDRDVLQQLQDTTHLTIILHQLGAGATPLAGEDLAAYERLLAGASTTTQAASQEIVSGYTLLNDVHDQPAILLEMVQPRNVYLQGQTTLGYFLISLIILGLVFTGVTLFILERTILRPLNGLSRAVDTIRETDDLATRVPVHGSDELAILSLGFNEMVDALAASRTRLQNAHDDLDRRVQERTAELTATNAHLEQEIEERKQAQQELAVARDQARDALRLKTQILANVSHEARTPLNIIMMHTDLLRSQAFGPLNEKQQTKLDDVLISARQLLGFLDNLLGEAQMSHYELEINLSEFNPVTMLSEVVNMMKPLADRRGRGLRLVIYQAPKNVSADRLRLKQIVTNLVDNAIKFSDNGDITVSIAKSDDDWWTIEVRDQGVGIAPEVLDRIYDTFFQVDGTTTREVNRGVGLGLSIVQQLLTLMGGEIQVTSAPQQGSTFVVRLPLKRAS